MHLSKYKKVYTNFLILFFTALIAVYFVVGTGRIHFSDGIYFYLNIIYMTFAILFFIRTKWLFWVGMLWFLFLAFYSPVGILQGAVNEAFVMSIWGTYSTEATEFVQILPLEYIIFSIISIILILFFWFITPKNLNKKQFFILFFIFVVLTATGKPWKIAPTSSFAKAIKFFYASYNDLQLYKNTKIVPAWKIIKVAPKYKNYVIVIGESARKDYHHIYGYSVENTPFLDSVNGLFVDGFNSVGLNTIPALTPLLSYHSDKNLNIIDLANMANFETYWLSNQGYLGFYDTEITIVAKRAKHNYFLNKDSNISEKTDRNLVKKVEQILANNTQKNRLIVLHFIGSHPITCNKLVSKEYKNYKDKKTFNINCYVESIKQTDSDLKALFKIMSKNYNKDNKESFSLIYFSDHGLTHNYKKNPPELLIINNISKEHLQVPLVRISSDDTKHTLIKNQSFGNYFPPSFAKWIGVEASNFENYNDIFSKTIQKDTLNSRQKLIKNKKPDLPIDISKFK